MLVSAITAIPDQFDAHAMMESLDRWLILCSKPNPSAEKESVNIAIMNALDNALDSSVSSFDVQNDDFSLSTVNSTAPLLALAKETLFSEGLATLKDSLLRELDSTDWMFSRIQN